MQIVRSKIEAVEPLNEVELGEIILVKMRGFPEWPARIIEINENLIRVQFFGDQTTWTTTLKNTYSFQKSANIIINNLRGRKNMLYSKAVKESEVALGIPDQKSILNMINKI